MSKIPLINSQIAGAQLFTTSGIFDVPSNVSTVYLTGCAAGGGGGGSESVSFAFGGAGGGGETCLRLNIAVTPGSSIIVTIPGRSSGGVEGSPATDGTAGGNTTFGGLLTLIGGGPGLQGPAIGGAGAGGAGGGTTGLAESGAYAPFSGCSALFQYEVYPPGLGSVGLQQGVSGLDGMTGGGGGGGYPNAPAAVNRNGGQGGPGMLLVEWGGTF